MASSIRTAPMRLRSLMMRQPIPRIALSPSAVVRSSRAGFSSTQHRSVGEEIPPTPKTTDFGKTFAAPETDEGSEIVEDDVKRNIAEFQASLAQMSKEASLDPQKEAPNDMPWEQDVRLPRNVQAAYLRPLRREAKYGIPTCDLQMRSYSIRNLELFADFAMRAAYYLKLPAYGPVPLPRITERWTVPRSVFIFKKSQENYERITMRRLIQIRDGHPETVQIWLAFLREHQYYGVGMKANVWEHNKVGVGKEMDMQMEKMKGVMANKWAQFGRKKMLEGSVKDVVKKMKQENKAPAAKA